jgi:hypothetical protein
MQKQSISGKQNKDTRYYSLSIGIFMIGLVLFSFSHLHREKKNRIRLVSLFFISPFILWSLYNLFGWVRNYSSKKETQMPKQSRPNLLRLPSQYVQNVSPSKPNMTPRSGLNKVKITRDIPELGWTKQQIGYFNKGRKTGIISVFNTKTSRFQTVSPSKKKQLYKTLMSFPPVQ